MVHHIVMWKFKPEIEEERKADLKKDMEANLSSLISSMNTVTLVVSILSVQDVPNWKKKNSSKKDMKS